MTDLAIRTLALEQLEYAPSCLTYVSAAELQSVLAEWAQDAYLPEAALDLTKVSCIDSQGLGLLFAAVRHIRQSLPENRLRLINPHPRIINVFQITGLLSEFEIVNDPSRYKLKQALGQNTINEL